MTLTRDQVEQGWASFKVEMWVKVAAEMARRASVDSLLYLVSGNTGFSVPAAWSELIAIICDFVGVLGFRLINMMATIYRIQNGAAFRLLTVCIIFDRTMFYGMLSWNRL